MPLTRVHTFTAEKYLLGQGSVSKKDYNSFILGANFPDIRDTINIQRDTTHPPVNSISMLENAQSYFLKGVYFHSLIDNIWYGMFKKNGFLEGPSEEELAIKTLEERYTLPTSVPQLSEDDILEIQQSFNISRQMIVKWYRIVFVGLRSNNNLQSSLRMLDFFPQRNKESVKKYYLEHEKSTNLRDMHRKFLRNVNLLVINV